MTGALKYALLQSFLLATGDDPEDERRDSRAALGSERVITPEQVRELQRLIEETETELERVLAYYRISALGEMTEGSYCRALRCSTANSPNRAARRTEPMPKIERLQQNTADWHRWRQQGLGASDAPVIMGEAAFKTPRMLWSSRPAACRKMRRGRRRGADASWSGARGRPTSRKSGSRWSRCAWCTTNWNGCVPRRWAQLRRLNRTEIKCPMNGRDQTAARQGSVPPQYYAQLQHELGLAGGGGALLDVRRQHGKPG